MARPVEIAKGSRFMLLASLCVVVSGLYFAREVLIPLALAILLSFLLTRPVGWLERIRLPRIAATLIVVAIGMGLIGGLGYVMYRQVSSILTDLPKYQEQIHVKLKGIGSHGVFIKKAEKDVAALTSPTPHADGPSSAVTPASPTPLTQPSSDNPMPVRVIPDQSETIREYLGSALDRLGTAAIVLVFVIFMLLSREDLRDRVLRLLGHGRINLTTQAIDEASTRITNYLSALSIVNGCYGIATVIGLWTIGKLLGHGQSFPNVLLAGIIVGLSRFVPYIGIWIGAGIPLALAFAVFPGNGVFLAAVILFLGLELVVSQFVEPMWYGSSTGMSALAVLVAAVFWSWLWGPIGLLLSTPLTVCIVVIGKYVPQLKFLDILLREAPVLSPPFRFYQRLIALDQEEAADLAREYLKEKKSLEAAYDDLLLPSLLMAEQDSHHERVADEQLHFVRTSVRDIVEELAEQYREMLGIAAAIAPPEPIKGGTILGTAASTVAAAASTVASVASSMAQAVTGGNKEAQENAADASPQPAEAKLPLPRLPHECVVKVLCLPARDEADEISALMLSQLLELRGYCVFTPTADALAGEMVDMIDAKGIDLVCVSALPPAAVAHARYLCKRVHARFADMGMVVGLWTMKGDLEKARTRIACASGMRMVTTLHDAQEQIDQLSQPIIVRHIATPPREPERERPQELATVS